MKSITVRLLAAVRAGVRAYRESAFSTTQAAGASDDFASYASRSMRYQVYWGLYENTVYIEALNRLATKLRNDRGLYRSIRSIYNPAYRLGEFYATHLMGGNLDTNAGDGVDVPSALPIADASPELRLAISRLWRDSNWQTGKSIWGRYGAVMGDAPMEIVNDPIKKRVTIVPVDPRKIADFLLDAGGNVRGYTFQEMRPDPRPDRVGNVLYTKTVERGDGDDVVYRTYIGDQVYSPYAWGPEGLEWTLPYGFVPFVWAQHSNVGAGAGWSEIHAERGKIFEIDDQASALHDYVRRMANAPFAIPAKKPNQDLSIPRHGSGPVGQMAAASGDGRADTRDQQPILWTGENAGPPVAMVTNLNIADVVANIASIGDEIERDFPELMYDKLRASGDASGEALRIARQPAEAKVLSRRTSYDDALVRAHQMAAAIGGLEEYEGYRGFGLDSYRAGALDHSIGDRPVFGLDEADRIADELARGTAMKSQVDAGVPVAVAMRRTGFQPDEIAMAERQKADDEAKAQAALSAAAEQPNPDDVPAKKVAS